MMRNTSLPNPRPNKGGSPVTLDWIRSNTKQRGDCWVWLGSSEKGYGKLHGGRVHRVAYELAVGPVPSGLVIDHLCRERACCNPAHLEPVTTAENTRRGKSVKHVGGVCRACGSENLRKRRWGHTCDDCRKLYEATPERMAQKRAYDKQRANTPERREQRRIICARWYAKKKAARIEGRNAIGAEIDPDTHAKALLRISGDYGRAAQQGKLF